MRRAQRCRLHGCATELSRPLCAPEPFSRNGEQSTIANHPRQLIEKVRAYVATLDNGTRDFTLNELHLARFADHSFCLKARTHRDASLEARRARASPTVRPRSWFQSTRTESRRSH